MADLGEALGVLRERFGHNDFRAGQAEIIAAILDGENVLAVLPTGSGKSLLYQLPALLKRSLTLVVSPLVSLMRDQVQALVALGIPAAALHSAAEPHEIGDVLARLRSGRLKLLYLAPERLDQPTMIAALRAAGAYVMAVDEAHCIAHWGHEFRPEYRGLLKAAEAIGIRQIVAVTATAAPPTRAEIIESLFRVPPRVFAGSFARPNLSHRVERRRAGIRQIERFLADHAGQSGIVYCATREKTDRLARQLRERGYNALAYHAGLDGGTRHAHQDEFVSDKGVVMVATIAFGMGIDKADVRFICHADLPSSMEAYYQETGRAGRDGLPAETLLLYAPQELESRRVQLAGIADPDRQHEAATKLDLLDQFCRAPSCREQMLLRSLGADGAACGRCDNCRRGFLRLRRAAQVPLSGAAFLRSKASAFGAQFLERRAKAHGDAADDEPAQAFAPRVGPAPALTVAQQRRLLRLKSARLALAKKRRSSPQSVAPDALLQELAATDPLPPEVLIRLLAAHDIRDGAIAQSMFEILLCELQSA